MISSLVECLGCLVEPSVAEVTATGLNWCVGSYVDFFVICERGVIIRKAPAGPVTPRNVRAYISIHVYSGTLRASRARFGSGLPIYSVRWAVPERLAGY